MVLAVGCTLAIAACGSDSNSSSSPTTTAASAVTSAAAPATTSAATTAAPAVTTAAPAATTTAAAKPTGDPIKLMVMTSLDDPNFALPEAADAAKAAAQEVNDKGGVNGHPLAVEVCNVRLDQALAEACAQTAIADKVSAAGFGFNTSGAVVIPELHTAGIPWLSAAAFGVADTTVDGSYPIEPGGEGEFRALGKYALDKGFKKVSIVITDSAASNHASKDVIQPMLTGVAVNEVKVPLATTDYTPYAQAALKGDPELIMLIGAQTLPGQILPYTRDQGYKGDFIAPAVVVTKKARDEMGAAGDGFIVTSGVRQPSDPAAADFNATMDKYAPNINRSANAVRAWAGIQLVAELLKNSDKTDAAALTAALNSAKDVDLGVVGPVGWGNPPPVPQFPRISNPTVAYYEVKGGDLVPFGDGKFVNPFQ
jgi:ABC-type branched-subunit amino acid transport system substrate-binding protein